MAQAKVFVSGFIQGVGYRQFVKKTSREFGLNGWVKNLPDGQVEALFSGSKDKIEKATEQLWKGPFLSEVKSVDVEWVEEENFEGFEIIV